MLHGAQQLLRGSELQQSEGAQHLVNAQPRPGSGSKSTCAAPRSSFLVIGERCSVPLSRQRINLAHLAA